MEWTDWNSYHLPRDLSEVENILCICTVRSACQSNVSFFSVITLYDADPPGSGCFTLMYSKSKRIPSFPSLDRLMFDSVVLWDTCLYTYESDQWI